MADPLRAFGAFILLCLAAAPPAAAQHDSAAHSAHPAETAGLAWLVGSWRGPGTSMGKASEARLELRPVLGGRFLELRFEGASRFEGRGFYRHVRENIWSGHWFDSHGSEFGIDATLDGKAMTSEWGTPDKRRGRTIYRLREDGRLELIDYVVGRDGTLREFARHLLTKAP